MKKKWVLAIAVVVVLIVIWFSVAPPRFILNLSKKVAATPGCGARLVQDYGCRQCHQIGGRGALVAPKLDGITQRVDDPARVTLRLWLRNPKAVKPATAMPNFHLSDYEIDAIIAYLEALDRGEAIPPGGC
ncbi:MAG: hypothetical protein D6715_13075 [Calditrichaeota bacterium]|nr:MAG: hypothetical protein D6715_13075 [Calditrichota bacterium]